jgi:hypothetical protein
MRKHNPITFLAALAILLGLMPELIMMTLAVHDYFYPPPSPVMGVFASVPPAHVMLLLVVVITSPWTLACLGTGYGLIRRRRWAWRLNMGLSVGTGLLAFVGCYYFVVGAGTKMPGRDLIYTAVALGFPCSVAALHVVITHGFLWRPATRAEFR